MFENFQYEITGKSGHDRISKLLPPHWIDITNDIREKNNNRDHSQRGLVADDAEETTLIQSPQFPIFLWENEYDRHSTRHYRNKVRCYSHLPNGSLLDDKWALARLFSSSSFRKNKNPFLFSDSPVSVLPSYCFQGSKGFYDFALLVGLLPPSEDCHCYSNNPTHEMELSIADATSNLQQPALLDLLNICNSERRQHLSGTTPAPSQPNNLWVVKDAATNGAGGIWVVSSANASSFYYFLKNHNQKQQKHRYVAQKYAWPLVLYRGRKFHVRVYSAMTADASIYVHRMCFLHVANDPFSLPSDEIEMPDTVHITNCCANSDDADKFTGEIVASLFRDETAADEIDEESSEIDLSTFFPSISSSIQKILVDFFPFVKGGSVNGGFEYMGLDFLLSYEYSESPETVTPVNNTRNADNFIPKAYLLEINAPPSQGTATGLSCAEKVHDAVLKDLMNLWVRPCVEGVSPIFGEWKLVGKLNITEESSLFENNTSLTFHEASMMNRIRWKLFDSQQKKIEAKMRVTLQNESCRLLSDKMHLVVESFLQGQEKQTENSLDNFKWMTEWHSLSRFVRQQFPYFLGKESKNAPIFLESGGGSQVPQSVIDAMTLALSHRDRSTVGLRYKELARNSIKSLLGISSSIQDQYVTFLGPNASSLLATLACNYINLLSNKDEIVVAEHNHEANITPWIEVAKKTGAKIRWWGIGKPINLSLSSRTRIVALSHASNVLGCVYDIRRTSELARYVSDGKARVVVDGVASVPHRPALMADSGVDWYVLSCHKCFGPHLGALCGRINAAKECDDALRQSGVKRQAIADCTDNYHHWENGTVNYEACAGVLGVDVYFQRLASITQDLPCSFASSISVDTVLKAYERIWSIEALSKFILLNYLYSCPNVHVLEEACVEVCSRDRLPIISFVHETLSSLSIVQWCSKHNITCRNGRFLSSKVLEHYKVCNVDDGVVRFSLAHYNTPTEVQHVVETLKVMDGW